MIRLDQKLTNILVMKYLFAVALFTVSACTTIEITERDAFDSHKTITAQTFNYPQYTFHEVTLETKDGEKLNSWFLEHEDAESTVVYFGGNGFLMVKAAPLIKAYSTIPVNLLMFDYRGYGLSSGEPTVNGIYIDADTAYDFARNNSPAPSEKIFIHGHSMGSFLSAYITDKEDVDGYILESPITDVDSWTRGLLPWILRPFIHFDIDYSLRNQNNVERVSNITKPLLIMGGSADEVTPFNMAEELELQSVSPQKRLVKINGGTHNNLPSFMTYKMALEDFLTN